MRTDRILKSDTTEIRLAERPIQGTTGELNPDRRKLGPDANKPAASPFGLTLSDLTPSLASSYKLEGQRGVVVKEVNPESYIADVKVSNGSEAFAEGDLIRRINRVAVTDLKTFQSVRFEAKARRRCRDGGRLLQPVGPHAAAKDRSVYSSINLRKS